MREVKHVEAGTIGRLIRVCMEQARQDPRWRATLRHEEIAAPSGTVYRQRLERMADNGSNERSAGRGR